MNTTNETTSAANETSVKNTTAVSQKATAHRQEQIAPLPKETRDMINVMLEDGLPYHILIDELGDAGEGLSVENLASWVQGRYQEYLKDRNTIEHVKARKEFASDLLRELGDADPDLIYRACRIVAALQIFDAILEHGDEALRRMLHVKPASYVNLMNGLCNISNTDFKQQEQMRKADEKPQSDASGPQRKSGEPAEQSRNVHNDCASFHG